MINVFDITEFGAVVTMVFRLRIKKCITVR